MHGRFYLVRIERRRNFLTNELRQRFCVSVVGSVNRGLLLGFRAKQAASYLAVSYLGPHVLPFAYSASQ